MYTTAAIKWHVRHARDMRISPGVLARSGSITPSMKTLDHADTHVILLFSTRCVRQTNSGRVHSLSKYIWFCIGMYCALRMCARISRSAGPFELLDSFHESPSPCPHAPVSYYPVRGQCSNRAAVMNLRPKCTRHVLNTPPVV